MKPITKIISIIVIIIVLLVGSVVLRKKNHVIQVPIQPDQTITTNEPKPESIPQNQELCFSKNFNGDITEAKLTIDNANVTGTFNWIPFEKDSARGTLSGTVGENGEMNLLYDYIIEGAHQTEEKIMKIEDGKLLIKHGELLDQKYDGHLVYKEKTSAVYSETLEACK
jgi:hypothetical protein